MEHEQRRRQFLSVAVAGTAVGIAGCSSDSDSGNGDTNSNGDDSGESADGNDGNESADGGSETTDGSDESGGGEDGASFDLDLVVDQLPDAFESLVVEFTGFEFFTMTGSTVTFESDPVQVDLVELASSGGSTDLMETSVPADEYGNITYLITVTDTTMSNDGDEQTFRSEEDGEVLSSLGEPGEGLGIESGESITLTAELSVEDAFDYDWKFQAEFSVDRES